MLAEANCGCQKRFGFPKRVRRGRGQLTIPIQVKILIKNDQNKIVLSLIHAVILMSDQP